jgi:hypothetical protein
VFVLESPLEFQRKWITVTSERNYLARRAMRPFRVFSRLFRVLSLSSEMSSVFQGIRREHCGFENQTTKTQSS